MTNTRRTIGILLLVAGVALAGIALWSLISDSSTSGDAAAIESELRAPDPAPAPAPPPSTTSTTRAPVLDEPAGPTTTTEPPQEPPSIADPIGLRIDGLNVDAPVGAYGVNERTGQMAVPDNVTEVGWYRFGPSPGEPGSAVLAAHVDLAGSGPGVFFDLHKVKEGDRISVLHEDGTESPFVVVARATYNKEKLPLDAIFAREGPTVLTLITCGGGFNSDIGRYDSNVVVYAVPYPDTASVESSTL